MSKAIDDEYTGKWLECAMCGAANAFMIDANDPVLGYCRVEDKHWRIELGPIYELAALRDLREVAGMNCEQLPFEVREALHRIPGIEKHHQCVLSRETKQ